MPPQTQNLDSATECMHANAKFENAIITVHCNSAMKLLRKIVHNLSTYINLLPWRNTNQSTTTTTTSHLHPSSQTHSLSSPTSPPSNPKSSPPASSTSPPLSSPTPSAAALNSSNPGRIASTTIGPKQFSNSEILMKSRHLFIKGLVYKWKWMIYVWTTLYIFLVMVMVLVFFLKPLILPVMTTSERSGMEIVSQEPLVSRVTEDREVSETLTRLQQSRKKRKAALLHRPVPEPDYDSSAASSITVTRGETHGSFEEGSGDFDSVSFRGFDI